MQRLVLVLVVSFGSLLLGYGIRLCVVEMRKKQDTTLIRLSNWLKLFTILGLQPVAIVGSFWQLSLAGIRLAILPALGAAGILLAGLVSIALIRLERIPPSLAASVFVSASFSNIGLFGGLIAFVLFGAAGYSLLQLYRTFEEFLYYTVGFPISDQIARGNLHELKFDTKAIKDRPFALIPLGGIAIGLALNLSPLPVPGWLPGLMQVIIPLLTGLLGFAIGLSLKIRTVAARKREIWTVIAVKFLIVPGVLIPLAWLLGMGNVLGGLPLKIVAIGSLMPSAFLALVVPVIYDFDLDTANSAWLITTAAEIVIIPALYFVFGVLG